MRALCQVPNQTGTPFQPSPKYGSIRAASGRLLLRRGDPITEVAIGYVNFEIGPQIIFHPVAGIL